MKWNNESFAATAFVDRVRLRRAALRYIEHGWPVTPGACLAGSHFVCGRFGCPTRGCHPALEDWEQAASTDVARVAAWWRRRPHTVLLTTGIAFDVLEVPASVGLRALATVRLHAGVVGPARTGARGPVAVTPTGRFMFLVRPGDELCPELANRIDIVLHGRGSWVPAAPSRTSEGAVRWAAPPEETLWRLPDCRAVQQVLVDALRARGDGGRPRAVPGQFSTARRAA